MMTNHLKTKIVVMPWSGSRLRLKKGSQPGTISCDLGRRYPLLQSIFAGSKNHQTLQARLNHSNFTPYIVLDIVSDIAYDNNDIVYNDIRTDIGPDIRPDVFTLLTRFCMTGCRTTRARHCPLEGRRTSIFIFKIGSIFT